MAFFAKVSDPRIGGTYMTLLNTLVKSPPLNSFNLNCNLRLIPVQSWWQLAQHILLVARRNYHMEILRPHWQPKRFQRSSIRKQYLRN